MIVWVDKNGIAHELLPQRTEAKLYAVIVAECHDGGFKRPGFDDIRENEQVTCMRCLRWSGWR